VRISFTPAPLGGGAYFWSDTQSTAPTAAREGADPPRPPRRGRRQTFILPNTPANRFTCGGCHAASRDGRTVAFSAEQDGFLTVSRADNPNAPLVAPANPPLPDSSTMTLNADGHARARQLRQQAATTGASWCARRPAGGEGGALDPAVLGTTERKLYFPDWSPDGTEIVATARRAGRRSPGR
jgi:hypothetical protein